MPRKPLTELIDETLLMDGAMGTLLQRWGLPERTPSCLWNLQKPEAVQKAHTAYRKAGSQILLANTFSASRLLLKQVGFFESLQKINETGVQLARQAAGKTGWVLGDIGPTGVQGPPSPKMFEQRVAIFSEQLEVLSRCEVDGILLETLGSLEEVLAGLETAQRFFPQGPLVLLISIRQNREGRLEPDPVAVAKAIKQARGRVVPGVNCSEGPEIVWKALREMASVLKPPFCAKPNAGLPTRQGNRWVYPVSPPQMGRYALRFVEAGARWIGGCCGTDPDHIRAMGKALRLDKGVSF